MTSAAIASRPHCRERGREPLIDLDQNEFDTGHRVWRPQARRRRRLAPKSTTRSPERAGVAAANSMASVAGAVTDFGCPTQSSPEKATSVNSRGSVIGPQFVAQAGVAEKLAALRGLSSSWTRIRAAGLRREPSIMLMFDPAPYDEYCAIEQCADRRNQHHIVGPNNSRNFYSPFAGRRGRPRDVSAYSALAALAVAFYLL